MEATFFNYGGRSLPARVTMGALRDFKRETGYDFLTERGGRLSSSDLGVLLWASLRSECRVCGVDFPVSLDDFLDRTSPEEVSAWYTGNGVAEPEDTGAKKKKPRQ